jgi:hypothetical protein
LLQVVSLELVILEVKLPSKNKYVGVFSMALTMKKSIKKKDELATLEPLVTFLVEALTRLLQLPKTSR